jgi:hypothetical protein
MELSKKDDIADAEEAASRVSDPQIKAHTLQGIATSEASSGRDTSAISVTDKITDPPARADALASLALEQAEKGEDAARFTLQLASTAAKQSIDRTPAYVFETIAVTHAILGDFDAAKEIVKTLSPEARSWPWWNITAMMVAAGDLNGAVRVAGAENDPHAKAYALLGAANGILELIKQKAKESQSPR